MTTTDHTPGVVRVIRAAERLIAAGHKHDTAEIRELCAAVEEMHGGQAFTPVAADLTEQGTEPEPVPDSGPAFDRSAVEALLARSGADATDHELRQVVALLADRDRQESDAIRAVYERDAARRQRDAARVELAEVTVDRDRLRDALIGVQGVESEALNQLGAIARLVSPMPGVAAGAAVPVKVEQALAKATAERDAARAERDQVRYEAASFEAMLATARAERDNLEVQVRAYVRLLDAIGDAAPGATDPIAVVNRLRDEANAHEGELGEMRAQMSAAEAEVDRLRGELDQARRDHPAVDLDRLTRDAQLAALEWATSRVVAAIAQHGDALGAAGIVTCLNQWITEVREGRRVIRSASSGEGAGDGAA